MDVDEALRNLRAADPAAGVDGSWPGSAAERRTQQRDTIPISRRSVWPAVAAAAVVLAVAIGASVLYRSNVVTGHGSAGPPPAASGPRGRADALLSDLLAAVPVLPGATRRASAPTSALARTPTEPASPNALDEHTWWTAPGSTDAALGYFRSHPPRGTAFSGSGGSPASVSFDGNDTPFAREVEVQVSIVALSGGIAVRADAQAIWIPPRDPDAVIVGVSSVAVTVVRSPGPGVHGAPTVTRTLSGSDAQTLAEVANSLPVPTPGTFSCPAEFGGVTDTLDFATSSGRVHVVVELTGCGGVQLVMPDRTRHSLQGGALDRTLLRLLGLPADYGLG